MFHHLDCSNIYTFKYLYYRDTKTHNIPYKENKGYIHIIYTGVISTVLTRRNMTNAG